MDENEELKNGLRGIELGKTFLQLSSQDLTLLMMAGSKLFSRLRITAEVLLKKNKTC